MDVRKLIEEGARLACCPKGCKNAGKRLEDRAYWADLPCNSLIHRDEARAVIAMTLRAAAKEADKNEDAIRAKHPDMDDFYIGAANALSELSASLHALAEQVEKANG